MTYRKAEYPDLVDRIMDKGLVVDNEDRVRTLTQGGPIVATAAVHASAPEEEAEVAKAAKQEE